MSIQKRIQSLIDDRIVYNQQYQKVISENRTGEDHRIKNFGGFCSYIKDWEQTLSAILINEEVIGELTELKIGYSTGFSNRVVQKFNAKIDLLEQQVVYLEESRQQLRNVGLWKEDSNVDKEDWAEDKRGLFSKELTLTKYKSQIYKQAIADIDSLIDFV